MTWLKYWIRYSSWDEIRDEALRRGIIQGQTIPPAIIYGEMSVSELVDILPTKYMQDGAEYYTRKYPLDNTYHLTSLDEIKRFLKWNIVNKNGYIADYYDCDNFGISLYADALRWTPGLAFGFFITTNHAKNLVVCSDKKIYEIEPQSDVVNELTSPCSLYMF